MQDQLTVFRIPVNKPLNKHGLPILGRRTVTQNACYWNGLRDVPFSSELRGHWTTCTTLVALRTNR